MTETFGERLQRLREAAGLSQPQAAAAAEVPVGTLRNWEQGRRIPVLDAFARLTRVLGVSMDAFQDVLIAVKPTKAENKPKKTRKRKKKGD